MNPGVPLKGWFKLVIPSFSAEQVVVIPIVSPARKRQQSLRARLWLPGAVVCFYFWQLAGDLVL